MDLIFVLKWVKTALTIPSLCPNTALNIFLFLTSKDINEKPQKSQNVLCMSPFNLITLGLCKLPIYLLGVLDWVPLGDNTVWSNVTASIARLPKFVRTNFLFYSFVRTKFVRPFFIRGTIFATVTFAALFYPLAALPLISLRWKIWVNLINGFLETTSNGKAQTDCWKATQFRDTVILFTYK